MFVFQGVAPGPQHSMFVNRLDDQMKNAWTYLAKGQKSEAQKCFAVSTSRINSDFVYFIFHHLRHKGYECFQAPYFAGAQLAHFAEQGLLHTVFGPPGLLLYNIPKVAIHVDFQHQTFDWVDLQCILNSWQISKDQFIDACMLAGTEYCLTYPYLNLGHFQPPTQPGRFNFDAAVYIIKQAPLINWMQTFPTSEMREDHVDGYCVCKVLIQSSPVLHTKEQVIRPLGSNTSGGGPPNAVPYDFGTIMGEKLPNHLYLLMCQGIISHKLPQALAKGEWTDKSQPLVDTQEFRQLLQDLQEYREKSLGLIAKHLHQSFMKKQIVCKAFWEQPHQQRQPGMPAQPSNGFPRVITPQKKKGLRWRIEAADLQKEMQRQQVEKIDFKFCLNWHANEFMQEGSTFYANLSKWGDSSISDDKHALSALVHFMLLEHLELIAEDGGMTVLGDALKDTPKHFQEPCLVALEMMKFGILSGEPFDAAVADRPFPDQVNYPTSPVEPTIKATLLLSRVMSLVPMKLKNDMWNADVDFDLAAFHSLVRILKRTLRQLTEASLCSILLKDLSRVKFLPPGFMCASPKKEDHLQTPALLPTFMLPRACMGIVVLFFLNYRGEPGGFV